MMLLPQNRKSRSADRIDGEIRQYFVALSIVGLLVSAWAAACQF